MMRTGVDLVEIKRIQGTVERYGERFLKRIYTARELAEVGNNYSSLAARFAAKEAVSKALGSGIGTVAWQEIEIQRGRANQPILHLYGAAQELARELGLKNWSVSLSHSALLAIAFVVASGDNEPYSI
jgi:holo-[acyl-carrier protein] synthase